MSDRVFKKINSLTRRLLKYFLSSLVGAVVIALAFFILTTATASTQFSYAVTELEGFICATDLNDLGQVVGCSSTSSGATHASLWKNGKVTDLGTLPGGTYSYASYINNKGQVVGYASISSQNVHAFLWENGQMTDLGTLRGDTYSYPRGINERGQIIGQSYSLKVPSMKYPNALQAFLWENGKMTNLGTLLPGDMYSYVYGINNRGQVIGNSSKGVYGPFGAFLWQNRRMTNLGTLGGTDSEVSAINNIGQVVGLSSASNSFRHAFLWQNGKMIDLYNTGNNSSTASSINKEGKVVGTVIPNGGYSHAVLWENRKITYLGVLNRKYKNSTAISINDAGKVIGVSSVGTNEVHPFLWDNGKMSDLNDLLPPNSGWVINSVQGINNRGQIFGMGKFNGNDRAFLLTPVRVIR